MNRRVSAIPSNPLTMWRIVGWGTLTALLSLPGIAMEFTEEVRWEAPDFILAAIMLGGVGLAFEMAVRASGSLAYRGGAAIAIGVSLLTLWVNGAVGIAGDDGDPIDLWFNVIPLLALVGSIGAKFRAHGLAVAMQTTAVCQIGVGLILHVIGYFTWPFVFVSTAAWLSAAYLFTKAAAPIQGAAPLSFRAGGDGAGSALPLVRDEAQDRRGRAAVASTSECKEDSYASSAFLEDAMLRFARYDSASNSLPQALEAELANLENAARRSGIAFVLAAHERERLAYQYSVWLSGKDVKRAQALVRGSLTLLLAGR